MADRKRDWLGQIKAAIAVLSPVLAILATYLAGRAGQQAEQLKVQIEQRGQQGQFDIKAYELVENALTAEGGKSAAQGLAANAIVASLTRDPLRGDLLNALRIGLRDSASQSQAAAATQFDQETRAFVPGAKDVSRPDGDAPPRGDSIKAASLLPPLELPPARAMVNGGQPKAAVLDAYKIDVFYCESRTAVVTAARMRQADSALVKIKATSKAQVRSRLLPALVQARPGYQSFNDEVRYDDENNERQAAQALAEIVKIPASGLVQVTSPTPGYLSVFYCKAVTGK